MCYLIVKYVIPNECEESEKSVFHPDSSHSFGMTAYCIKKSNS